MKGRLKKILSFFLVIGLVGGVCQIPAEKTLAATTPVKLDNLGSHGTTKIGSKTKSGDWYKMTVDGKKAFCMNLGYTCHTGDQYSANSSGSYSTADGGKKALKAYIGYWYDKTMKKSNKAYVIAQALLWGVQEGKTSESELKTIITSVKSASGYYSSKTTNQLYSQIFKKTGTLSVDFKEYKYSGNSSHRQVLLQLKAETEESPEPHSVNTNSNYRQKIRFTKMDDDGRPVAGAKFSIEAKDIDTLYYYKLNDKGSNTDEEIPDFTVETTTDSNGQFTIRYTYHIQSETFYFYTDTELKGMTAAEKEKAKRDMDEAGQRHGAGMTQSAAEELMKKSLKEKLDKVNNQYIIKELDTGNPNLILDPELAKGVTVICDADDSDFNYGVSGITDNVIKDVKGINNHKKATVKVKKLVSNTNDKKAHGDASVEGAVYQLFDDAACTKTATVYDSKGKEKTEDLYIIKNGELETDYLRAGKTYYLKEKRAPEGFLLSTDVLKIQVDGNSLTQEYTPNAKTYEVQETEKKGHLEIYKFTTDGSTGPANFEKGATFEITKKGKKYEECKEDERAILVADENGHAKTTEALAYGTYVIHQTKTGDVDTEKIADEEIEIGMDITSAALNYKVYTRLYNNAPFKAHLRIIKKSKNTEKTVLKANTKYQIYQVEKDGTEKRVEQSFFNGNTMIKVGTDEYPFVTDASGEVLTAQGLSSGKYRIYEVDSANGLHITTKFIEFVVDSKSDNYKMEKDAEGNSFATITLDYVNEDTYGKLKIYKSGEMLSKYENGQFIYEEKPLKGATFEIYADGNIETQDNQGTNWYDDGELVATIKSGEKAVFTKECKGITGYEVKDGIVTVNLPLGKYKVKETKTLYGYLLPDKDWSVEFNWNNKDEEYVLNSTSATNTEGILSVFNERAKTAVEIKKTDEETTKPIKDVTFGLYSKDAIYNADGKQIASADEKLGTVITDEKGQAVFNLDLPLMSENYGKEAASGSAVSVSGSAVTAETNTLNSGDYYLKEESVPGGYYLDSTLLPVHLEYKDDKTAVIEKKLTHKNKQTEVQMDKTSVAGSEEIEGCHLQISDEDGNVILSWTSGTTTEVKVNQDLGYQNLLTAFTADKHRTLRGLYQHKTYILTETRPADGYVTADSIAFQLQESSTEPGKTLVSIRNADGNFVLQESNVVHMVDYKTTVTFKKKSSDETLLGGAKMAVYDSQGNKVTEFTTKKGKKKIFTGLLKVGETYTFKEIEAPEGYELAKPVTYQIKDTKDEQIVSMVDKKLGIITTKTPKKFWEGKDSKTSPKTGYLYLIFGLLLVGLSGGTGGIMLWRKGKKYEKNK